MKPAIVHTVIPGSSDNVVYCDCGCGFRLTINAGESYILTCPHCSPDDITVQDGCFLLDTGLSVPVSTHNDATSRRIYLKE